MYHMLKHCKVNNHLSMSRGDKCTYAAVRCKSLIEFVCCINVYITNVLAIIDVHKDCEDRARCNVCTIAMSWSIYM